MAVDYKKIGLVNTKEMFTSITVIASRHVRAV